MIITVLHLSETLTLGGCCRVMEHLAASANAEEFNSLMCGMSGDAAYLRHLESRQIRYMLLEKEGGRMLSALPKPWVAVLHRAGNPSPFWNRFIPLLKEGGAAGVLERNIFGYADKVNGRHIDRICANSINTLWHHWRHSRRPALEPYLANHRVLYNALDFTADETQLWQRRMAARAEHGIPPEAFVLGVVTRPDAGKIDALLWALAPRLKEIIPGFVLVTRRYPQALADKLTAVLGDAYRNLPVAHGRDEMLDTYAMMDVFGNFPGIGESFGMALAEAMRAGVPAVAMDMPSRTKGNSQRELIVDGKTGYLPGSPAGILRALEKLAADAELRTRMGAAARARMQAAPFALSAITAQFEEEMRSLAGGRKPELAAEPSHEEIKAYLQSYPNALPDVWQKDPMLNLEANAKRLYWKVIRKVAA